MEANTGAMSLWRKTLKRCEGKFQAEDLIVIRNSKGVDDVLVFINEECEKPNSRVLKWVEKVKDSGDKYKAYQECIDTMLEGIPFPGNLIWGSIKLVLSVSTLFDR